MKPNNDTFDFNRVGKRMPYRTPDGFFETNKQRLMEEAAKAHDAVAASAQEAAQEAAAAEATMAAGNALAEKKPRREQRSLRSPIPWKQMMMGAAAAVALLVASYGIVRWATATSSRYPADTADEAIIYASSAGLGAYADDGEDWSDFADADIFLDCWE